MLKQDAVELKELSQGRPNQSTSPRNTSSIIFDVNDTAPVVSAFEDDGVMSAWAWTSAFLYALFCLCFQDTKTASRLFTTASIFTLFPRFLLFIGSTTSDDERRTGLTPLESFVTLHAGLLLYAVSVVLVVSVSICIELLSAF